MKTRQQKFLAASFIGAVIAAFGAVGLTCPDLTQIEVVCLCAMVAGGYGMWLVCAACELHERNKFLP